AAPAVGEVVDEYLARVGVGVVAADARPGGVGAGERGLGGVLGAVPVAGQQVRGVPQAPVASPRELGEVLICACQFRPLRFRPAGCFPAGRLSRGRLTAGKAAGPARSNTGGAGERLLSISDNFWLAATYFPVFGSLPELRQGAGKCGFTRSRCGTRE